MAKKNEVRIHEAYERHMEEFMLEIRGAIRNIYTPAAVIDVHKTDPDLGSTRNEFPAPLQEEHSGPDKVNEIRHDAAAAQSPETRKSIEIRNPDKQQELLEIVKHRSEKFERELRGLKSLSKNAMESATQKFKGDLIDNVRKQLTKKK